MESTIPDDRQTVGKEVLLTLNHKFDSAHKPNPQHQTLYAFKLATDTNPSEKNTSDVQMLDPVTVLGR